MKSNIRIPYLFLWAFIIFGVIDKVFRTIDKIIRVIKKIVKTSTKKVLGILLDLTKENK